MSSRPGSGYDDAGFTAGFVNDHISPSSPDIHMMQRPSSALGIMKQSQANVRTLNTFNIVKPDISRI